MKAETKNLAGMVRTALRRKTWEAAACTKIMHALSALQAAAETELFFSQHPAETAAKLGEALGILAELLYLLHINKIPANKTAQKKLRARADAVYETLYQYLSNFTYMHTAFRKPLPAEDLLAALSGICARFKENNAVQQLFAILQPALEEALKIKTLSFHRWCWWSFFATSIPVQLDNITVPEEWLVRLNFNSPAFIEYLSQNICGKLQDAQTIQAKSQWLMQQLVQYKTLKTLCRGYLSAEASVRQTMIAFLQAQLKWLPVQLSPGTGGAATFQKLSSVLSVPQLALLIRLLAETKILNEPNHSALLKNAAGVISTPKAASVSAESLRVNYYTPNTATKTIVKEYLLQMLRLVNSY